MLQTPQFNFEDPFLLEDQLTDDERMVRDTARALRAGQADAARPRRLPQREHFDRAILQRDGRARPARRRRCPDEYGGAGVNGYVSYGLVAREVERVDSGYRSMHSACRPRW